MDQLEKREWRERRSGGWSETLYSGLFIPGFAPNGLLVSKLSHGLRVLEIEDLSKYNFISSIPVTGISEEAIAAFVQEVLTALEADKRFQSQSGFYQRAMA